MGALDHWLTPPAPENGGPAISAIPAIPPNEPYKNNDLTIADACYSPAIPATDSGGIAAGSNGPATPQPAENIGLGGAIAEIAEIAGVATPLGAAAMKSRLAPTTLDPAEWIHFYTERAAILEHAGGATCEQAARLAFEGCVAAIGWALPADFPQDQCAACGARLGPQAGLPLSDQALVCDGDCHRRHRTEQRERAVLQLSEWGISAE